MEKIKECIIEGCRNQQFWAKYCEKHYNAEFNKNRHMFTDFGIAKGVAK